MLENYNKVSVKEVDGENNKFYMNCPLGKRVEVKWCRRCSKYVGLYNSYYSSLSQGSLPEVLCEK